MPRVIGIDPGTVSIDLCGLEDGQVFLDRSLPTSEVIDQPARLMELLDGANADRSVDLIAGPSGYGLPLTHGRDLTDTDIRLAQLTASGEQSVGIVGLGSLMRLLARSKLPVVFTPGVIHLPTVPAHRKVNRVDMGTADKVCAAALALHDQVERLGGSVEDASFILLELGGAFTAAIAAEGGRLVDGIGGSAGPLGLRAAGALDGEVAFLAGSVSKKLLFGGGAASVAGDLAVDASTLADAKTPRQHMAWDAYLESAAKAVAALTISVSRPREIIVSGRLSRIARVRDELERRLDGIVRQASFHVLSGFADVGKQAAQGAALLADGLTGGRSSSLVERMRIRDASGTVLDHLHVISPAAARARLGIDPRLGVDQ